MAQKTLFVRDATGLVKELSTTDCFIWSVTNVPLLLSFVNFIFWVSVSGVVGVNYVIPTLVWMLGSGISLTAYYIMGTAMPRSGGDYAWGTRALHPLIGFMMSWSFFVANLIFTATGPYGGLVYLSTGLILTGKLMGDVGLQSSAAVLTQQTPQILIGIGTLVLAALATLFGKRILKILIYFIFIIGAIGVLAVLGMLVTVPHTAYVASFNSVSGLPYDQVLSSAQSQGLIPIATMGASLSAVPFAMFALAPSQTMVFLGGEVKSPKKTFLYGMMGAWAVSGIIWLAMFLLLDSTIGTRFVEAMSYLSANQPAIYAQTGMPAGVNPIVISLLLLTKNPLITFVITLAIFAGNMGWMIIMFPVNSRILFAWAFDRLGPTQLAHVSDRWGTPTYAVILFAIASIGAYLILFLNPAAFVLNGSVLIAIWLALAGLTALVLPYRRKDIFERSPIKTKVAGIPLLSILGLLTFIIYGYMGYLAVINPAIGTITQPALMTTVGVLVLAVVLFYLSVAIRKHQGIDLRAVFSELPPE